MNLRLKQEYLEILKEDLKVKEHKEWKKKRKANKRQDHLIVYVNTSSSAAIADKKDLLKTEVLLESLVKQKGKRTVAKKSIANYRLKEGADLGLKVTLVGYKAFEFWSTCIDHFLPVLVFNESMNFKGWKNNNEKNNNVVMGWYDLRVFNEYKKLCEQKLKNKRVGIDLSFVPNSKVNFFRLL